MYRWKQLDSNTHQLALSDSFTITLYSDKGYAEASGVDGSIGLGGYSTLSEQQKHVQEVTASVLLDLVQKLAPEKIA